MSTKKYILLVDDDPLLAKLYETTLKAANYDVSTVSSGELALSEIDKKRPDLMLLDIMMPKMSGVDVLKKIKENKKNDDLKVVILTNFGRNTEEAKAVHELGISDYLIKSETSLKELLEKALKVIEK
jgi:two-component system phosphate regulon response regulator PhoB